MKSAIALCTLITLGLLVACGGGNHKITVNKVIGTANDPSAEGFKFNKLLGGPCLDIFELQGVIAGITKPMAVYTSNMNLFVSAAGGKRAVINDDMIRAKILFGEQGEKFSESDFDTGAGVQSADSMLGDLLAANSQVKCASVTFSEKGDKTLVYKANGPQTSGDLNLIGDNKEQRSYHLEKSGDQVTSLTIKILTPLNLICEGADAQPVMIEKTYQLVWGSVPFKISRQLAELMVETLKPVARDLKALLAAADSARANAGAAGDGDPEDGPSALRSTPPRNPRARDPRPPALTPGVSPDELVVSRVMYANLRNAVISSKFSAPACKTH